MASHFSKSQWQKISALFSQSAHTFGLPKRNNQSVVIGSFNIRKLGAIKSRTAQSWAFLTDILKQFDLIAIQEVMDDLSGLEHLFDRLGSQYGMVVSDVTGAKPGASGNAERLAFVFRWKKIQRTALASDITFDRSEITSNLYENRTAFNKAWKAYTHAINEWKKKAALRKAQGKRAPTKPSLELPKFLSFIRQPHCVSFRIAGKNNAKPYEFLAVNAHLLYGANKQEREWEFFALLEWLTTRAKYIDKLYHPNLLLLGDCNLDFDSVPTMKEKVDAYIKSLNKSTLKSKKSAKANFPMLSAHPTHGILRSALRQQQTYDQIGLFSHDSRLPQPEDNAKAGQGSSEFDYGVFNLANLFAHALHQKDIADVSSSQRKAIYKKSEFDVSDHMPIWMRLKIPQ